MLPTAGAESLPAMRVNPLAVTLPRTTEPGELRIALPVMSMLSGDVLAMKGLAVVPTLPVPVILSVVAVTVVPLSVNMPPLTFKLSVPPCGDCTLKLRYRSQRL